MVMVRRPFLVYNGPVKLALVMVVGLLLVAACGDGDGEDLTTTSSSLQYVDLVVGTGAAAKSGATATVHYTGWLLDDTQFDSSLDRGQPFKFVIGAGQVIKGWDEGVGSMNVGGKRKLIIPPGLAYGSRGSGATIPPDATLVFEVELLGIE